MKIAYNPQTEAALTAAPSNNDITFDLKGIAIYAKGVKFKGTDTTYSVFKKHTSDNEGGYNGLVPVPSYTTTTTRYLREDGTWVVPTNYYRPISVNGTSILENNNTALNLVAGANISITAENSSGYTGKVTITNTGVHSTTINGNYLRVNTNGTNTDLTIPYATSAGSIAWANISGKPSFATVATSGSYNDLSNKPSIPTVTDYYWADVKVSASSSTSTSPTFTKWTTSDLNLVSDTTGGKDLGIKVTGKSNSIGFIIGSGNANRGIYDYTNSTWILQKDASNNTILPSGNVGIGVTSPSQKLHVGGLVNITANSGTLTIGCQNTSYTHYSTTGGTHWFNKAVEINGNLTPHANASFNLGSSSKRWSNIYGDNGNFSTKLNIDSGADAKIILNNTDTETKYQYISFRQEGTEYGYLGTLGNNVLIWTGYTVYHSGNLTKSTIGLGNVQNTAFYQRDVTVNGTAWNMAGTWNSAAFTIYAPTTAGTSGQVLTSTGGTPGWTNQSSLSAGYLTIHDIRNNNYAPNSTSWPQFNIRAWFNNTGTPNGDWWSGITVKGWTNDYNVWQLASTSTNHSYADFGLFFRTGNGSSWTNWKNVVTSESVNNIVVTSSLPATKVNNTIYILV